MQVDPMNPTLKEPGSERSNLKYNTLLSNSASNSNLRSCMKVLEALPPTAHPMTQLTCAIMVGRCRPGLGIRNSGRFGGGLDSVQIARIPATFRNRGSPAAKNLAVFYSLYGHFDPTPSLLETVDDSAQASIRSEAPVFLDPQKRIFQPSTG